MVWGIDAMALQQIRAGSIPSSNRLVPARWEKAQDLSFTGQNVHDGCAIERFGLQLGGRTPMLVFDDADVDAAVPKLEKAVTVFAGQFCMTGSRLLVQSGGADQMRKQLAGLCACRGRVIVSRMNLSELPAFATDETFHVVVETPRGSTLKLKYDVKWQAMSISRPLPLGVAYPLDWGFVPSTQAADGDPLDAMLFWDVASYPGVVVPCRAIGVLQVEQNHTDHERTARVRNDRILAVPLASRREADVRDVASLAGRIRQELEQFAVAATALEGKDIRIVGWGDAATALALVRKMASPGPDTGQQP